MGKEKPQSIIIPSIKLRSGSSAHCAQRFKSLWVITLLIGLGLATWWRFSHWMPGAFYGDDLANLLRFRDGVFASSLGQALTQAAYLKYRPIFEVVIGAAFSLFGSHITYYLVFNIILQALSGVLLFLVAYRLSKRNVAAAVAIAVAVVTSRFALYQVSQVTGLLMSVSWLLFLVILLLVIRLLDPEGSESGYAVKYMIMAVIVSCLAIQTYELYIVIAPVLALVFWISPGLKGRTSLRGLAVLGATLPAVFNIAYKTLVLRIPFFVGTGGTLMGFNFSRVITLLSQGIASVGGFNSGPSYLIGQTLRQYSPLEWILAGTVSALWMLLVIWGVASIKRTSKAELSGSQHHAVYLLLIIAAFGLLLLGPPALTIRLEQRWLFGPFSLVLLIAAWAIGRVTQRSRKFATAAVLVLCGASISLDAQIAQHFGKIYMVYSARFAAAVRHSIAANAPKSHDRILFFARQEYCSWVLQNGKFFSIYGLGARKVSCDNPWDTKTFARQLEQPMPKNTEAYLWTPRHRLVNSTAFWQKRTKEYRAEKILVNFISIFQKGIINDDRHISTPSGRGVFIGTYYSTKGPLPTITVLSNFTYQFSGLHVLPRSTLSFGVSMVYPTKQVAKVVVWVRGAGSKDYRMVYVDELPLAIPYKALKFVPVRIPLRRFRMGIRGVRFGVEPTGNNSDSQWVAFSDPVILVQGSEIRRARFQSQTH